MMSNKRSFISKRLNNMINHIRQNHKNLRNLNKNDFIY